jgi:hypothetical protein
MAPQLCHVVEIAYISNGWHKSKTICVLSNGAYECRTFSLAEPDRQLKVYKGVLPSNILTHLRQSLQQTNVWRINNGVPIYVYSRSNFKNVFPPAVDELLSVL